MSGRRSTALPAALAAGLALVTILAYAAVVRNGFVAYDDDSYLTGNREIAGGLTLEGAAWAFRTTRTANWHPVTWVSHMLDVQLFGLRPAGHHLVSLLLHAASAVLLFFLLRSLTGALWRPALVAALFAVHPLHVESVAWASERKDVLSILLMFLAAAAYVAWVRRGGAARSAATAALFALSLMAKPTPVTLPFLLLLLDWWPLGRWAPHRRPAAPLAGLLPPARLWLEKAPLFLLSAASSVVTYLVQSGEGAVVAAELVPLPLRAANAAISAVRYLGKAAWPSNLAVFYPYRSIHDPSFTTPWWQWAGALLLIAAGTLAAVRAARRRPWYAVGWFWYLGTLVPVIGLVQVGGQAMADRYTYLPLTGIALLAAWGAAGPAGSGRRRMLAAGGAATAVLLASFLTARQVAHWRDSVTLFDHAARATTGNFLALNNLGVALMEDGRMEEARNVLEQAIRANPRHCDAYYNMGNALFPRGRYREALPAYQSALQCYLQETKRRTPFVADTLANIAGSHFNLGQYPEAEQYYRWLLQVAPADKDGLNGIALTRARLGKGAP